MLLSTMRAADGFHGRLQAVASYCAAATWNSPGVARASAAAPMERHVRWWRMIV
jgi:hypothetical protein